MFNEEKKNFPVVLFIMSSLFVFIVFIMMVFVFLSNGRYDSANETSQIVDRNATVNDKLFLDLDYEHNDPYTTKIPNLRDMLTGPIITDLDPSLGDIASPVTLVLFSDFECAYCAKQEETLKEVMNEYKIRLIWKDYPASDPASRSYQASIAARCAQVENAFWDYHDLLFKSDNISRIKLLSIAEELHLDIDEFTDCLDNSFTSQLVHDNMLEAEALGIDGIPFLYVNDQEMLGEIDKKDLEHLIEIEMEKFK